MSALCEPQLSRRQSEPYSYRLRVEPHLAANEFPEFLVGQSGLKPYVEINRGLDVVMAKDTTHVFVVARVGPKDKGRRSMPELMHGDEQSRRLLNALGDLVAQRSQAFVLTVHAGKQPRLVGAAQQHV